MCLISLSHKLMQNGLRSSDRESFLQRTASNHHEVILRYLAFKNQFSQKLQSYSLLTAVYYTDFFQHNSFCTGHRLMKKHLSLKNSMLKQMCDPSHCSQSPQCFMNSLTFSHLPLLCHGSTNQCRFLLPEAATQIWSSQPVPLQTSALYWEQLGNRVLQKALFSGAQPRHFSLMPYFSGLCTPCDLDLHFACLRIKKKRALICATAAAKL